MTNFLRENQHLFIALILVGVLMLIYKTYDLHMLAAKTDAKVTGMRVRSGFGASFDGVNSQTSLLDIASANIYKSDRRLGETGAMSSIQGFRSGMGDLEPPVFWNPGSYLSVADSQSGGIKSNLEDWGDSSNINTGATKLGAGVTYVDSKGEKYGTGNVVTTVYDANGKVISTTQGTKYGTNLSGMYVKNDIPIRSGLKNPGDLAMAMSGQ